MLLSWGFWLTNIAQDRNDDTQNINCFSVGDAGCFNGAVGDGNIQNMKCNSVGDAGCQNSVNQNPENLELSNDNTQNMKCLLVKEGCLNSVQGDGNDQKLLCVSSVYPQAVLTVSCKVMGITKDLFV